MNINTIKKSLLIISALVFTTGASVCMKTGTYVGVIKKNVNGTNVQSNASDMIWRVDFDYGTLGTRTITGTAACNTVSGTVGVAQTNLYTSNADAGTYCWCRMWPVSTYGVNGEISSHWTLFKNYASESACASSCTSECASAFANDTNAFRTAMFEAIW